MTGYCVRKQLLKCKTFVIISSGTKLFAGRENVLPRFFRDEGVLSGIVHITGKDAEHIRVLRLRPGETFTICDGKGKDYICRLLNKKEHGFEAEVMDSAPSRGEPTIHCTVYTAFPKGDKAETIIQKSVEQGAARIVFFPSLRCVSRPDRKDVSKKLERWQRISEEAAKQSERGKIPEVHVLESFETAIAEASKAEMPLFFYEGDTDYSIKQALSSKSRYATVSVVTGPEGGFEPDEVMKAREHGMLISGMGKRILRCETAPLCALAAVMFHTDNL